MRWALVIACFAASHASTAFAAIPDYCYQYNDRDTDGFVYGVTGITCPRDDCDDDEPSIHPGAAEICGDNIDQDCDGRDAPCAGTDDDRDGYRSRAVGGDDCDDRDANVHPGLPEVCGDGKDNDCSGGDRACATDADGDGYPAVSAGGTDCNDRDPAIHPRAVEICGDTIDQDCAGGDVACEPDADRDRHDALAVGGDDCDDFDAATHPGADDLCGDGRDQDCSGADAVCPNDRDLDGDGHAALDRAGDDCDDRDPNIYPTAAEICGDGRDQDCDGGDRSCTAELGDVDGDGVLGIEAGGPDCNDSDAAVHPGALEICGDGRDQDCDESDARVGTDAVCDSESATNAAFDAVREHSPVRTSDIDAAENCAASRRVMPSVILFALVVLGLSSLVRRSDAR